MRNHDIPKMKTFCECDPGHASVSVKTKTLRDKQVHLIHNKSSLRLLSASSLQKNPIGMAACINETFDDF